MATSYSSAHLLWYTRFGKASNTVLQVRLLTIPLPKSLIAGYSIFNVAKEDKEA
jgi:hypothetical protein